MIRIFKSNKIPVLIEQASNAIRAEHRHMTKLTKLLSILLGDASLVSKPEDAFHSPPPMDDSESEKDVDIMDIDDFDHDPPNGDTNGHLDPDQTPSSPNGINGAHSHLHEPPQENGLRQSPSPSPSTPQTRPTTRLQTLANNPRPSSSHSDFTWPFPVEEPGPATSIADLGITPTDASDIRRIVQAGLERSQEFLRCLEKVRMALARADTQRKTVWMWCRDSAKLVEEQELEE
jgi:hypothetical protein